MSTSPKKKEGFQVHARLAPDEVSALREIKLVGGCSNSVAVAAGLNTMLEQLRAGQADAVRKMVSQCLRISGSQDHARG